LVKINENFNADFCDCINGGCNFPDQCDCTSGWTGGNCTIPTCQHSCNNGHCIAPDVCQCNQGKILKFSINKKHLGKKSKMSFSF